MAFVAKFQRGILKAYVLKGVGGKIPVKGVCPADEDNVALAQVPVVLPLHQQVHVQEPLVVAHPERKGCMGYSLHLYVVERLPVTGKHVKPYPL